MQKASMGDGNVSKVVFASGSKSTNFVSKNRPRIRTWFIIIVAVVLVLGAVVLSAVFMRKTKEKTHSSRSVTEVNLEEGEILTYRVERKLEIRAEEMYKKVLRSKKLFNSTVMCLIVLYVISIILFCTKLSYVIVKCQREPCRARNY